MPKSTVILSITIAMKISTKMHLIQTSFMKIVMLTDMEIQMSGFNPVTHQMSMFWTIQTVMILMIN